MENIYQSHNGVDLKGKSIIIVNVYVPKALDHMIPGNLPDRYEGFLYKRDRVKGRTTYKNLPATSASGFFKLLLGAGFKLHHILGFEKTDRGQFIIRFVFVAKDMTNPNVEPWAWDVDGKGKEMLRELIEGLTVSFYLNENGGKMVSLEFVSPQVCYFPHFQISIVDKKIVALELPWKEQKERNKEIERIAHQEAEKAFDNMAKAAAGARPHFDEEGNKVFSF